MNRKVGWVGFVVLLLAVVVFGYIAFGGGPNEDDASKVNSVQSLQHSQKVSGRHFEARRAYADQEFEPTHRQVDLFHPTLDGERIYLQTFCLDPEGNIWACVGGSYLMLTPEEDFIKLDQNVAPMIQVYSPELKLIRQIELPFTPTAINFDAKQDVFYVGGQGQLAMIDRTGKTIHTAKAPNAGDLPTIKASIRKQIASDTQELIAMRKNQVDKLQKKIDPLIEKKKAGSISTRESRQLTSFQKLLSEAQLHAKQLAGQSINDETIEEKIRDRLSVKSIAVCDSHLFIAVLSEDNYNYEIHRTNKDFSEPEKILDQLRGCCGQFDIKQDGDDFWFADNIHFRVVKYDARGERLDAFGHNSREQQCGFGSCCNPMNLRVYQDGRILTAESTIGDIKWFSPAGKLLGYVGKAKVANGCKNVSIGFDAKRNVYYLQHQDKHALCIMRPVN